MRNLRRVIPLVNRVGAAARALGVPVARLDVASLEAAAAEQAGSDDFGDPYYRAGLEALAAALDGEARLHTVGRLHMRNLLVQALVTRARLTRSRRQRNLDAAPLAPPLIVCGLPRSGTTFLHRLLSELDAARPLPMWELAEPIPGPGPDRRLEATRARVRRMLALAPEIDAQHFIRAELPDECGHLFKPTFLCSLYWQAPAYGYMDWYLRAPTLPPYRDYRALLALLARPGRLTLKDPFHARHLESLFAVIPDARVVVTHRDPVEVVPSLHKLARTMQRVVSDAVDVPRMVELNTRWLQDVAERHVRDRERLPGDRVFDVDYRDLLTDPLAVVRRVCAHFGLPYDDARLRRFVADNPQRKHGPNPYAAEEFGQRPESLAERFRAYRERYITLSPSAPIG